MGAAGPTVSPLGLGTWRGFESPSRRCADILGACVDAGVTFIDTAESYADGQAVRSLGRLLSSPRRDAFFLSTKVFYGNSELPGTGLGRRHVRAGLHWTLRALDTDNVDLLQAHDFDEETPLRDVVTTFGELVHEGRIGCWGTSRWSAEHVLDAVRLADEMRLPRPVSNQTQLSLLQQTADTDVLPAAPGGPRPRPGLPPRAGRRPPRPDRIQLALAWVLGRDGVACTVVGARDPGQVVECAASAEQSLDESTLGLLDVVFAGMA